MTRRHRQQGVALVLALGTVAVIATLTTGLLWMQWQQARDEQSARQALQARWVLDGAVEWAAAALRDDGGRNPVDHLGEAWAIPLPATPLRAFLALNGDTDTSGTTADAASSRLAGQVRDLQGRLNLANARGDAIQREALDTALSRLFTALDLPADELSRLRDGIRDRLNPPSGGTAGLAGGVAAVPWPAGEPLTSLGLSTGTARALTGHLVWLPEPTPVNVHTASAEVLHAVIPGLSLGQARSLVQRRAGQSWRGLPDVARDWGIAPLQPELHTLATQYFLIRGDLQLDGRRFAREALLRRQGSAVRLLAQWPVTDT